MKNKIGWCDMTWNPVWGCRNKCEYCYARGIVKRFYKQISELEFKRHFKRHPTWAWTGDYLKGLKDFKPTFLYSQYCKKLPKKPQKIFIGSMSEIYYWEKEWIEMVIEKVKQYPQHIFQFLTRRPEVYLNYSFPINCWLGITIADIKDYDYLEYEKFKVSNPKNLKYISFEPLLCRPFANLDGIDWVIVGAETGNRKDKVIPDLEWVADIVNSCRENNIPIYIKDSIKGLYPDGYKQFPKGGEII